MKYYKPYGGNDGAVPPPPANPRPFTRPFMSRGEFEAWKKNGGEVTPLFPTLDYDDCKRRWESNPLLATILAELDKAIPPSGSPENKS